MNTFRRLGNWIRALSQRMPATRGDIEKHTLRIEMKLTELVTGITELTAQTEKTRGEIVDAVAVLNTKIAALEAEVSKLIDGEAPPALVEAFGGLKASVQTIDDLNGDKTPPAP